MADATIDHFSQIRSPTGTPALAIVSPNTRVAGQLGAVGTAVDVVLMQPPDFVSANWLVPDRRTFVQGIPTVSRASVGVVYAVVSGVLTAVGPPFIPAGDPRLRTS